MTEIRECKLCKIDFIPDHHRQEYCKTKACRKDRQADNAARHYAKVPNAPGYNRHSSLDNTRIRPQASKYGKPRKREEE